MGCWVCGVLSEIPFAGFSVFARFELCLMDVRLPKIGDAADSGTVATVLVKVGDTVTAEQTILEIEQEKAVAPIRTPKAGTVTAIHVKEGEKVSVGTLLISIDIGDSQASPSVKVAAAARPASKPARPVQAAQETEEAPDEFSETNDDQGGAEPAASPYVRKVARELGIRLSRVKGSGSGGRVLVDDLARYVTRLEKAVARAGRHAEEPKGLHFPAVQQDFSLFGPVTSEPLTALRKVISARMVENSVTLPHVTQFDEVDMTRVEDLRTRHKSAFEKAGARLTPTPFILKALVEVLKRHPRFNASIDEVNETLVLKHYYHLGIAVDTLAQDLASIAEKSRNRTLGPDDMRGGTFTISNQGAIGGGHFTPIINKPEVAILGLGRTSLKPVARADGSIAARPMMPIAVSYDHRVIDGGAAARFVVDLVKTLEEFPESAVNL